MTHYRSFSEEWSTYCEERAGNEKKEPDHQLSNLKATYRTVQKLLRIIRFELRSTDFTVKLRILVYFSNGILIVQEKSALLLHQN